VWAPLSRGGREVPSIEGMERSFFVHGKKKEGIRKLR
jgi:hypothetical protein